MAHNRFSGFLFELSALLAITALVACAETSSSVAKNAPLAIGAQDQHIRYSGRSEGLGGSVVRFGYSGARVRLRFVGTSASVRLGDDSGQNHVMAWVDGMPGRKFRLTASEALYTLAEGLETGEHTVEVVRITECDMGAVNFSGFVLNGGAKVLEWREEHDRRIEFIGDSITCGYGIEADDPNLHFEPATENFCLGYSALAARQLGADYLAVSRSGIGMVRNYDGPREGSEHTMPEVYPQSFYLQQGHEWDFGRYSPHVVCINLGTNDFSTTGVDVEKFVTTYVRFARMVLTNYPQARLLVLQGPMENGEALRGALDRVVAQLGGFAPGRVSYFKLSAQGGVGFGADYHPNREQAKINAAELAAHLSQLMGWK